MQSYLTILSDLKYSLFLRFFLSFRIPSCYNPFEIQSMPSPFPAEDQGRWGMHLS